MVTKATIFIILGAGSIGERHIRNLLMLGYNRIYVFRQRNLPLRTVDARQITILTDWQEVIKLQPAIAIVCSPTALHLKQTVNCLNLGMHVLVEKPLSHNTLGLAVLRDAIHQNDTLLQVGYMMRYHPLLKQVHQMVEQERFGNLISFHSHWGEYLPNWHPWEDYRESYAARRSLGGGAGLTLSHDIDVALWIAGTKLIQHALLQNTASQLTTDTDEATDLLLRFDNGTTGHIHVNFFQKNPERRYEYRFDEATVVVDFFANTLKIIVADTDSEIIELDNFDRNDLFIEQTRDFLSQISSGKQLSTYSIEQIATSETILRLLTTSHL